MLVADTITTQPSAVLIADTIKTQLSTVLTEAPTPRACADVIPRNMSEGKASPFPQPEYLLTYPDCRCRECKAESPPRWSESVPPNWLVANPTGEELLHAKTEVEGDDDTATERRNVRAPVGSSSTDSSHVPGRSRREGELLVVDGVANSLMGEVSDRKTHFVKMESPSEMDVKDVLLLRPSSPERFLPQGSLGEVQVLSDASAFGTDTKPIVTTPVVEGLSLNIKKEVSDLSTAEDIVKIETDVHPKDENEGTCVSAEEDPFACESFAPESKFGDFKLRVSLQEVTLDSNKDEKLPVHFPSDGEVRSLPKDETPDPNLRAEETKQKMYNCGVCSATFEKLPELKKHVLLYETSRRRVSCGHCGKTFKQCSRLEIHTAIHTTHKRSAAKRMWPPRRKERAKCIENAELATGQSFLKCDRCVALFTRESDLSVHKLDHAREVFECGQCPASFANQTQLEEHVASHSENKPLECSVCKLRFRYPCFLKSHMRTHTGEKPFRCKQCPAAFCQMSGLCDHLHSHKERVYKCDKCPAEFTMSSRLKRHKQIHGDELLFPCKTCPAVFITGTELKLHAKTHVIGPFKCEHCDSQFKCPQYLKKHKRNLHSSGSGEKSNKCDQCPAQFASASSLNAHKFTHTGERPFKCALCSSAFTSRATLTTHVKIHTNERPFKCDQCPADFKGLPHLTRHMRIHSGDKPYLCQHCPLAFSDPSARTSHEKVHSKEKPYKCDQCPAKFKHATNLTEHKRIHTGEKPYACSLCDARFRQNSQLRTHKDIHSGLKDYKYKCHLCPVVCFSAYTLSNHIKGNHEHETDRKV